MTRTKVKSILEYFPDGKKPRPTQEAALLEIEAAWKNSDVIVANIPVAGGKSFLAETIRKWQGGRADLLTPSNILVKQYLEDFPDMPKILRNEQYECKEGRPRNWPEEERYSCKDCHRDSAEKVKDRTYCSSECQYVKDNRKVFYARGLLMNSMMYVARFDQRKYPSGTVIVDEAHGLASVIQELLGKKYWRKDWAYPDRMYTRGQTHEWAEERTEAYASMRALSDKEESKKKRLEFLLRELEAEVPRYSFERTYDEYRDEPEDVLKLRPVNIRNAPPFFWRPGVVRKIVLMSATISMEDIRQLGLDSRRVTFINAESPIPISSRPIIAQNVVRVNHYNSSSSFLKLARYVRDVLMEKHRDKGMIHTTYGSLPIIKEILGDNPRVIFHNKENKMKKFKEFLASPPEEGKVLVGCGLYEGVDLKGDRAGWQALLKVPYPSLADPALAKKCKEEPSYYRWITLRDVMQMSGRVCRGPDDYGCTYILDGNFKKLYDSTHELRPRWFTEAIQFV